MIVKIELIGYEEMKHNCDAKNSVSNAYEVTITFESNEWCLWADGAFDGTVITIKHCPFCGIKLNSEVEVNHGKKEAREEEKATNHEEDTQA